MKRWMMAATLLLVSAGTVSAQTAPAASWTFGVTGGYGRTWVDEGQIGPGALIGAFADRRISRRTGLELSADYLRHKRSAGSSGYFEAKGNTTFLTGALIQRFGNDSADGHLLAGLTLGIHSGRAGFPVDNLISETESTQLGLMLGAGMSIRAGARSEVGPIVRIAMLRVDRDSDPAFAIMGAVRIGLRR